MKLVAGHDATVLSWLAKTQGVHWVNQPALVMGVIDRDGVLRGCVILEQRNEGAGELHVWGQVSNDVAKAVFGIAFRKIGWRRLECRISRRNKAIRRSALRWGWRFECVAPSYFGPGEDGFQYGMSPAQCRWLGGTDGQVAEAAGSDERRGRDATGGSAEHGQRLPEFGV
jgi:hypothetical protein